jgi:hypothetical protein
MFRTADRRKSWKSKPSHFGFPFLPVTNLPSPALSQRERHAPRKSFTGSLLARLVATVEQLAGRQGVNLTTVAYSLPNLPVFDIAHRLIERWGTWGTNCSCSDCYRNEDRHCKGYRGAEQTQTTPPIFCSPQSPERPEEADCQQDRSVPCCRRRSSIHDPLSQPTRRTVS